MPISSVRRLLLLAASLALAALAACDDDGGKNDPVDTSPDLADATDTASDTLPEETSDSDTADASPDLTEPDVEPDAEPDVEPDVEPDTAADTLDATVDVELDVVDVEPPELSWRQLDAESLPAERWGQLVAPIDADSTYIFGGVGQAGVVGDLWRIDVASDGAVTATAITTTDAPSPRYSGCMAHDPVRNTLLVFGGRDFSGFHNETWRLDLGSGTWEQLSVFGPTTPIGCAMTWSQAAGAFFLFGGGSQNGTADATWRFDPVPGTWTRVMLAEDSDTPSRRYDAVLRPLDASGSTLLLHAGAASGTLGFLSDVWHFDVATSTWTEVDTSASLAQPPGRRTPWTALVGGGRYLISGFGVAGLAVGDALGDLWRLDLSTGVWEQLDTPEPTARAFTLSLPAGDAGAGVLLGGYDMATIFDEAWLLAFD